MRRLVTATVAVAILAGAGLVGTAPAAALSSGTRSNEPWVVEVYGVRFDLPNTSCTGTAIAADWILTADHCAASRVYYRYTPSPGADEVREEVPVAEEISLAPADMKLLRLSRRKELPYYPGLAPRGYRIGSVGRVFGMGESDLALQRSEKVWVRSIAWRPHRVLSLRTTATTGAALQMGQKGDSGGPLLVDGRLVGVFFGTSPAADSEQSMVYSDVGPVVAKLKQLQEHGRFPRDAPGTSASGILDVAVARGHAELTMSDALVHSGKRIVVWADGRYIGSLEDGSLYYSWRHDVQGATIMTPTTPVQDGDLLQIGELPTGVDVSQAELLFQTTVNGVDRVQRTGDRVAVTMSRALVNSGKRVVIWIDGVYRAEVLDDVSFYASKTNDAHGSVIIPDGTVADGALVQIGVLPAGTDIDQAEILDARVL